MNILAKWRRLIPDTPETLETRAIAIADDSCAYSLAQDGVLLVDGNCQLACLYGHFEVADFIRSYREIQLDCEVIAPASLASETWLHTGLRPELASLWRLGSAGFQRPRQRTDVQVRALERDDLDLPQIRDNEWSMEHRLAFEKGPVSCAFVTGTPAALAYVPWHTERFADLSVATLEPYRRQGVGALSIAAVIEEVIFAGLEPIWGAVASNVASRALARKLGFTAAAGELLLLSPVAE